MDYPVEHEMEQITNRETAGGSFVYLPGLSSEEY